MAGATFDAEDKHCWYFGPLTRDEANGFLLEEETGCFLVRDSSSVPGDFVLSVKEDTRMKSYIINKIKTGGQIKLRIGDRDFPTMPSLLTFYKSHKLDSTVLVRPARREEYVTQHDFEGQDSDDLPFKAGEVLTVLQKDEENWWTARDREGRTGLVPVPFLVQQRMEQVSVTSNASASGGRPPSIRSPERKLPAPARVIKNKIPSAYDSKALRLQVGEVVMVTAMHITGQWEGECNGMKGFFPFTHVEFIQDDAAMS